MKLKVKNLEWYHKEYDHEELLEEGYTEVPATFKLVGRDGYYCFGNDVWFETNGRGYRAYRGNDKAREYFVYDITVNDEAILPTREVAAMEQVLKTCRDADVKKALHKRLRLHEAAWQIRYSGRRASIAGMQSAKRFAKQFPKVTK
jgi:hypothetical protein